MVLSLDRNADSEEIFWKVPKEAMLQVWIQTQMSSNFIHNKVFTWAAVMVLIIFLPHWHVWILFRRFEVCYITLWTPC